MIGLSLRFNVNEYKCTRTFSAVVYTGYNHGLQYNIL